MYIWVLFTPFTTKMLIQLFTVYCLGYCSNPLNRLSSLSLSISRNLFQEPEWSFKNINMIMLLLYPDLSSVFPSHLKTKETFFQRLTELSKICFLIGFRYYSSCFCPPNPTLFKLTNRYPRQGLCSNCSMCCEPWLLCFRPNEQRRSEKSCLSIFSKRAPSTSIFSILLGSYWYITRANLRCKIWFDFPPSFSICTLLLVFLLHATSYFVLFKYFCFVSFHYSISFKEYGLIFLFCFNSHLISNQQLGSLWILLNE